MQERGPVAALIAEHSRARASDRRRQRALATAVAAVVVALDQLSKSIAQRHLSSGPMHVMGPLRLDLSYNRGAAFGLGRGVAPFLVAAGVVLFVVLVVLGRRAETAAAAISIALVLGGAAGNLVDRLVRHNGGAVIDFIDLRFWPVFNLADTCIVCGAVLLVLVGAHRPRS